MDSLPVSLREQGFMDDEDFDHKDKTFDIIEREYPVGDEDPDTQMDGETFRHLLSTNDEFRDRFESGQPMGGWDY